MLPGDLPLQTVTMVADALLASPVQVVEVALSASVTQTAATISDLCQRGREHLLVGVSGLVTMEQADALLTAGAQFVSSSRFQPELQKMCAERKRPYLPTVISVYAAQAVQTAGLSWVRVPIGGPTGPDYIKTLSVMFPGLHVVAVGDFTLMEATAYAQVDTAAIFLGNTLYTGPEQTMADLITRARQFQTVWETARNGLASMQEKDIGEENGRDHK